MSDKAQRVTVSIGSLEAMGKDEANARRCLDSKGIKPFLGQGYTPDTIESGRNRTLPTTGGAIAIV
jgi:hypothetical protein